MDEAVTRGSEYEDNRTEHGMVRQKARMCRYGRIRKNRQER